MDSGALAFQIIIVLIAFFFAAFFVACEFALVQTRYSMLEEEQENKGKSKKLSREMFMITNLNDYLSTTQVGVSLSGIIMGWIGEALFVDGLFDLLEIDPNFINPATAHAIGSIVGVLILTYLEVVFTEVVPKNISIAMPRRILGLVATPLHYFHKIFYPGVWAINVTAAGVVKLMGLKMTDESDESMSQAEILNISKDAVKNGALEKYDYLYMQRAFDFNDKVAKDIMIDRTQLTVMDINTNVKNAIGKYLQTKYSRIPIVENNNKDNILGYVYCYDMIRQSRVNPDIKVERLLRDIATVPENMKITEVLQQMIKFRTPIVVVVDEYGGTSGIITDKDIYEELFGTVRDEIDPATNEYIFKQPKGTYQVSGKMTTYDFERYFRTEIKDFSKSDSVTLSGYFIDNHPDMKIEPGTEFTVDQFTFKVLHFENSFINLFEVNVNDDIDSNNQEEKINDNNKK
ncbi:hemolysin family protein [Apilactobacillus timberlakei]|uniref:hemolysin family protein n=1 Tax=Apilactobacillus timberlakei TaxID=2008380 RepID=UPI00112714DD|nr:hemolysin family protein [Apilactobacillus timberlakei]TPR16936.1 HlyC/CorC family transporter [Apilactobacillus timberlakei]TPR18082.1 HlyC/CorC family transporter [Apilactobacillus timberlakei]TPR18589.1 HlyC/CorC family transporter [Apilactobacillus timberlakei]TPR20670.1 HlyC/CorC family transporter [Apilactobacillus timberlakei]